VRLEDHRIAKLLLLSIAHQLVWTGVGIIGGWLAAILTFSFYVRRWIGNRAWRWLHRWTLGAYILAVVHTIGSGTDAKSLWLIVTVIAITTPIVFGATCSAPHPYQGFSSALASLQDFKRSNTAASDCLVSARTLVGTAQRASSRCTLRKRCSAYSHSRSRCRR
jgi:predicted ferric reductase